MFYCEIQHEVPGKTFIFKSVQGNSYDLFLRYQHVHNSALFSFWGGNIPNYPLLITSFLFLSNLVAQKYNETYHAAAVITENTFLKTSLEISG